MERKLLKEHDINSETFVKARIGDLFYGKRDYSDGFYIMIFSKEHDRLEIHELNGFCYGEFYDDNERWLDRFFSTTVYCGNIFEKTELKNVFKTERDKEYLLQLEIFNN